MNKILLLGLSLMVSFACAVEIPIEKVKERKFGKAIDLNSKIIQLSSSNQSVMALVGGQIKEYYVKSGEKVKKGQKIALIQSITVSKMTSEFISLQKQYNSLNQNFSASQVLHKKGVVSLQNLNVASIQRNEMLSKLETLHSQLQTLGIDTNNLKNTSANYILYAHSDGTISSLLQPLQSVVSDESPIISIIKDKSYHAKSYLPLEYSDLVKVGQKIVINYKNKDIVTYITQILPELDEKTQRIILLSSIEDEIRKLYINSYVSSKLYFDTDTQYLAVKKSALAFFNNEWVVFIPKIEDEVVSTKRKKDHDGLDDESLVTKDHDDEKDDHTEAGHEKKGHAKKDHDDDHESDDHEEDNKNDDHEKMEAQYKERAIKIITEDNNYVAVKGLEIGEEYVSDKSFYVKSLILKSSMGDGHGH